MTPSTRSNVLRGPAPLPVNQTLRFPPATRHGELAPHIRSSALYEIQPVWIGREGQLEREVEEIAVAMPVDQSLEFSRLPHSW
jgi:hypothetical protein